MNHVEISGVIKCIELSHEMYNEKFYKYIIMVKRLSGTDDNIIAIVSEKNHHYKEHDINKHIYIEGEYRSYNMNGHLFLYVFANNVRLISKDRVYINKVEIEGYIGKNPIYRKTPFDREITDILLAVNRVCGRTDYIPCIAWGRNAKYSGDLPIGQKVTIQGRIQERYYIKDDISYQAYEVSIIQINITNENKGSA